MQKLISSLFDRWAGQPILVICGGPSVREDILHPMAPACVISANEHGFFQKRFKIDLVINLDKQHCMKKCPMQGVINAVKGDAFSVNPHSWADYRLSNWTFRDNTGLAAIALACALGGNPVIVTGIDMWKGGRVYFHESKARGRVSPGVSSRDSRRLRELVKLTKGANVRPLSGPLLNFFPPYREDETLPPWQPTDYRKRAGGEVVYVRAAKFFVLSTRDTVKRGQILAVSGQEATRLQATGKAVVCKPQPA